MHRDAIHMLKLLNFLKLLKCVSLGDQKGDQSAVWQPEGFETKRFGRTMKDSRHLKTSSDLKESSTALTLF